jgi:hypothetical protein
MPSTQQSTQRSTQASTQSLINQTVDLLFPRVWSVQDRKELLIDAFATTHRWILGYIEVDGTPNAFVSQCLNTLIERDCALVSHLLQTFSRGAGVQTQSNVQQLIVAYQALCADISARKQAIQPRAMRLDDNPNRPVIFLSYADADAAVATRLQAALAGYGHVCWGQRPPQKGSDAWLEATAAGLSQAYAVVLIASEHIRQDRWVQVELLAALDKQKRILTVQVGESDLPPWFPSSLPVIPFKGDAETNLQTLLAHLPTPPTAPTQVFWDTLSPDLTFRTNELRYIDRLKLAALQHVVQITQLGGETAIQRTPAAWLALQPMVTRADYTHVLWRLQEDKDGTPSEHYVLEDVVSELKIIRRAVLLGEPGSGKTTILYRLAADLIDTALLDDGQPVPVMVRLGGWTDAAEPFAKYLQCNVGELVEHWDEQLAQKRVALLLDGLNEIPSGQQRDKYRQVGQFLAGHPGLMVLVSCRQQDYPPERDLGLDRVVVSLDER